MHSQLTTASPGLQGLALLAVGFSLVIDRATEFPAGPYLDQSPIDAPGQFNFFNRPLKRPLSLTIIAWLSILAGGVCFLALLFLSLYADSGSSSASWFDRFEGAGSFILGTVAALAGGVGVLKRSSWSRWLILAGIVLLPLNFSEVRMAVIISSGLLLVVCGYFLFRPQASAYFHGMAQRRTT